MMTVPSNDKFDQAAPITTVPFTSIDGQSVRAFALIGSNTGATAPEPNEPHHRARAPRRSVWFLWTAPATERVTLAATPAGEDDFLLVLAVYTGTSLSSLKAVEPAAQTDLATLTFKATAGARYYVAIDGVDGAEGYFMLEQRDANNQSQARSIRGRVKEGTTGINTFSILAHDDDTGSDINPRPGCPASPCAGYYLFYPLPAHRLTITPTSTIAGYYFDPSFRQYPASHNSAIDQNYTRHCNEGK